MIKSYRQHFETEGKADRYETEEYASGSYARLLWELEKAALDSLVGEFRQKHPHISYLDFASGTGRLAAYLEDRVDVATSIEISESMATVARQKLHRTQVLCKDITLPDTSVEGRYDLITAFRFFLNAEPELQRAAIKALAARLKDETSWLVLNNHGNLWSSKILAWPIHRLRNVGKGRQPCGHYLRHGEIKRMLEGAGLRIIRVVGLGALGGTLCRPLAFNTALRLEQWCAANSLINRFGQDLVYVVCRDSGRDPSQAS